MYAGLRLFRLVPPNRYTLGVGGRVCVCEYVGGLGGLGDPRPSPRVEAQGGAHVCVCLCVCMCLCLCVTPS